MKNKVVDYPELNNKQLLSLIRANQIEIQELSEAIQKLEKKFHRK